MEKLTNYPTDIGTALDNVKTGTDQKTENKDLYVDTGTRQLGNTDMDRADIDKIDELADGAMRGNITDKNVLDGKIADIKDKDRQDQELAAEITKLAAAQTASSGK